MCMPYKASEQIFRAVAEHEGDGEDGYVSCSIKLQEVELSTLLQEANSFMLSQLGFICIDPKKGLSQEAVAYLKQHGWVHPSTVKNAVERKELEQQFWIMDKKGEAYPWYKPAFAELDLTNITDDRLKQLADGAQIVQKVTPKSVLPDKDYKRLQTLKKQKEEAAKKKKENAAKREAAKKQKEIEHAKQLLKDAGEL